VSKRSNRVHRALVYLAHLEQYKRLGPLIGPKEKHQPNPRWRNSQTDQTRSRV
jgi:hypothetical protein